MISRLILVGVVGVMGVSLPDGADWAMPLTWARAGATGCAGHRAAVAFEPIAIEDNPSNRIAYELNRQYEGLDILAAPIVRVATIVPRVAAEPDTAVERLFAENCVWGEPAREAVAESDQVVDRLFADNEVWCKPIGPTVPPAPVSRPELDPIAVAEGASNVADELNRRSEGLATLEEVEQPSIETALSLTRDAALAWMNVLTKTVTAPGHSR